MTRPMLIDTDPGIDDALAILLALGSPEVTVEAITTVAGNVGIEAATANALRILDVARPARRPRVARGAAHPLRRPLSDAARYHGDDGLGNLGALTAPDGTPRYRPVPIELDPLDGPDLILDALDRWGRDLVLVALGPLTNVAIALARDRDRFARLSRLVVMGGAVRVPGNVTPAAEFNFFTDPDAVATVLASGIPVEVVPLDVTRQVLLTRRALDAALGAADSPCARFLRDVTRRALDRGEGERGMPLHDPLAVGVALDPTVVGLERLHVTMETEGRETRGMSLADLRSVPADDRAPATCAVATSVDAPRFLSLFLERVCRPSA